MKKLLSLLIFFCSAVNLSAQSRKPKELVAESDTSQRFSFYLPIDYPTSKTYPIIIFLDPAARGSLPVSLYDSLADTYNIIMASSFNSRNFDNPAYYKKK